MIAAAAASVQWLLDAGDTQDRLITSNDDRVEIARAKTRFFFMYIRSNRHDDGPDADWASALFNSRSHDMPIEFPLFTESFFVLKCITLPNFFFQQLPLLHLIVLYFWYLYVGGCGKLYALKPVIKKLLKLILTHKRHFLTPMILAMVTTRSVAAVVHIDSFSKK